MFGFRFSNPYLLFRRAESIRRMIARKKKERELYSEAHLQGYYDFFSGCQNLGANLESEFDRIDYENGWLRAMGERERENQMDWLSEPQNCSECGQSSSLLFIVGDLSLCEQCYTSFLDREAQDFSIMQQFDPFW